MQFDKPLVRRLEFRADTLSDDDNTVELSFSSEEPYERYWGVEILDHSEKSVRLDRIRQSGPLLFNHDSDMHIGRVEEVAIENGRGKAKVKFSKSQLGRDKMQDVRDGILKEVSVGYRIHQMQLVEEKDGKETYRVTDWEPLEISLVTIPADTSVGVGRDNDGQHVATVEIINSKKEVKMAEEAKNTKPEIDVLAERKNAIEVERKRQASLRSAAALIEQRGLELPADALQKADEKDWNGDQLIAYAFESQPEAKRGADTKVLNDMQSAEKRTFSLTRLLGRMATQKPVDGFEREVCDEMGKMWRKGGLESQGQVVPLAVFRGMQAGDYSQGGSTVSVDLGQLIEKLDNQAVVEQVGATTISGLSGNLSLPRQTGGASAFWVAEGAEITESTPATDDVALTPRGLGALVAYTKQFLAQSSIGVEAFIRNDINTRLNLAIDKAAWEGSGVSGQPKGIFTLNTSTSGINTVTFGAAPTWKKVLEFESKLGTANALRGTPRFVSTYPVAAAWKGTSKDTGSGLFLATDNNTANGYQLFATNQFGATNANKVIFGNFADMILARWAGVDLVVDPYTLAASGKVRIVALTHVDIAYRHPESFVVSTDAGNQ